VPPFWKTPENGACLFVWEGDGQASFISERGTKWLSLFGFFSVDLQTKSATFVSGLNDAARNARSSFGDIRNAANDMGSGVRESSRGVGHSMMEARHGVMMLGEEFGIHLPRGLTTFIASLGPVGAAMEAAFPFLAIILGATLLIEHIMKIGEAEEKAAEAGKKLTDGIAERINRADQALNKSAIEIRKLAGDPARDLLSEKLRLEDAEKGYENVKQLDGALKQLLENTPKTSNWNPFNWFDNSGDVAVKAQVLQEKLQGKSQTDQADILRDTLTLQSHILEQMRGQTTTSEAELRNQQKYVDFLRQEAELVQKQADAAGRADQAQQGKDRSERIKKAEEEEKKLAEAREHGLDHRRKIETEYAKKSAEEKKKEAHEEEELAGARMKADDAFYKWSQEQEQRRAHLMEELGRESAGHAQRMAKLQLEADIEAGKLQVTVKKNIAEQMAEIELAADKREFQIQQKAYQDELASLDKNGKDYELKKVQLNNKLEELERQHENNITKIKDRAEQERNYRILAADQQFNDSIARELTQTLMMHQSFGQMMNSLGNEVVSGMMQNALKAILANDMTKPSDAAHAARKAWIAGSHFPFPLDVVMPPILAAAAFAGVMAFDKGGIVPGVEKGDTVPAMLTPGEGVIPKPVMDGLSNAARSGNVGSGHTTHVHVRPVYHVNAIDTSGFKAAVEKHTDVLERHFEHVVRRMNGNLN
jgi:hypothetical protein